MSDGARDLLVRGVAAIKEESYAEARRLLERALVNDPDSDQKTEILLWLVELTGDRNEQRDFLERVLSNDPTEPRARRKLAILDGKLKTDELFNPNKPPRTRHLSGRPARPNRRPALHLPQMRREDDLRPGWPYAGVRILRIAPHGRRAPP